VGKPQRKRPLLRQRCGWEDGIKIYLQETGQEGMDWILLAQDMDKWQGLVKAVINLQVT
jgi:hypothetical protein